MCAFGFLYGFQSRVWPGPLQFLKQFQREHPADHSGCRQDSPRVLAQALQAPPQHQPHAFRYLQLVHAETRAESAFFVEQLPFFRQMTEHLFDEKRIAFGPFEHHARQRPWRLLRTERR